MKIGPMVNMHFPEWWAIFTKSSCGRCLAETPDDKQSRSPFLNEGSEEENTSIQKCIESSRLVAAVLFKPLSCMHFARV